MKLVRATRQSPASAPAARAALPVLSLLLALAASCGSSNDRGENSPGAGGSAGGEDGAVDLPPEPVCSAASDCVAVPSTCCECPSFAVLADGDLADACGQVNCEEPEGCPRVHSDCIDRQCQLVCDPITIPIVSDPVCDHGFDRDDFGCLVTACRDSPGPVYACAADEDCAEVPADCCGCERGGANAAVAATAVGDYLDLLDCPAAPDCPPDVNVCDSTLVPRCIGQVCTLGPPPGVGVFCGVPDYPACPKGQACVLNHPDAVDATRLGLGTCHDA